MKTDAYPDAGFDLFTYQQENLPFNKMTMIDSHVKCSGEPMGFYVYPRSSISTTPIRLANSVGIIDSGYRGNLKFAVDVHNYLVTNDESTYESTYEVKEFARLFQVCSPTLSKIHVVMVSSEN
jgi:dUTP pyrophosphatase